ncbi:MAG: ECF-type sigma factor [Acidobacteria bacterium]|nr:ECF-type sigma factor [Acidobacteriota bacterium]
MEQPSLQITELLRAWSSGDQAALERLIPVVYDQLRRVAKAYVAKYAVGQMLQATEVVNETFVRLIEGGQITWEDRKHFFVVCARIMRNMLIDRYRHGRRNPTIPIDDVEVELALPQSGMDLLALDDSLSGLERLDHRQSLVVELRFFGGLTEEEVADVLGVSIATVKRDWTRARRWLKAELEGGSRQ